MRIDPDVCRDPDLLAAEVRRLRAVIATGVPTLTDEERAAIEDAVAELTPGPIAATLRSLLERMK